jgi:transketolase
MESLSDRADLASLRAAAARYEGRFATVAACLVAGGALEHDPDDPEWPDRDRLVVGDLAAAAALTAALAEAGHAQPGPTDPRPQGGTAPAPAAAGLAPLPAWGALPHAVGLAAASRLDGGVFRTWCLLGPGAVDHGATWEAARTAAGARLDTLVALVAARSEAVAEALRVFDAAGWHVTSGRGDEPAELLGAFDLACAAAAPALVAAVTP